MHMSILEVLLLGLVVGAVARFVVPGRDPIGIIGTMALGVAGSFLGWWIGKGVVGHNGVASHPWIWAGIGAVLVVLAYRALAGIGYGRRYGRRFGRRLGSR